MCAIERFEITVSLLIREKAFAAISNDRYHRSRQAFRERKSCKYHFISTLCSQTAFPQLSSRQRSLDSDTQTISRIEIRNCCRVYLNVNALASLYTVMYRLSFDRRPSKASKLHFETVDRHRDRS